MLPHNYSNARTGPSADASVFTAPALPSLCAGCTASGPYSLIELCARRVRKQVGCAYTTRSTGKHLHRVRLALLGRCFPRAEPGATQAIQACRRRAHIRVARHCQSRDLFMGHAPLLGAVQLDACQFPADDPIAAFSRVRNLTRQVNSDADSAAVIRELHPERFFASFPALETLVLNGDTLELASASWAACPPPLQTRLRHLTVTNVDSAASTDIVVRTFAHPGMLGITVDATAVSTATADLMPAALDDSATLKLAIIREEHTLECSVLVACARRRAFAYPDDNAEDATEILRSKETLAPAFARIARHLTHVAVSDTDDAWKLFVALFPASLLVNVSKLELVISEPRCSNYDAERPLALAALAELSLVAGERADGGSIDIVVDAHELLDFVRSMLDPPDGRRLNLVLED